MILLTADPHFSDNPRDDYRLQFLPRLKRLALQHKVELVGILGDLTEQKDRHSSWLVNRVVDSLADIARDVPLSILRGNHDGLDADNPFFRFLSNVPGIDFINQPKSRDGIMWLPHSRDPKHDWPSSYSRIDTVFTHVTFKGAKGENGVELDGIARNVLPATASIFSGDVHVPQSIGGVTYVGAPFTIDFGDQFKPRVLLLGNNRRVSSIALSGPQKRVLTITTDELLGEANKCDIVRIMVQLQEHQHAHWPELREQHRAWGERQGYVVDSVMPLLTAKSVPASKPQALRSDKQLYDDYCRRFQIEKSKSEAGRAWL
jgi:Calcineurin-like phosphoesterase